MGRVATAGALCLMLSGCFGPDGGWQIPSFMRSPAPTVPAARHYQPSAGVEINGSQIEKPVEKTRSRHLANHVIPAAISAPSPPLPPVPKPTVTLADGPSRERAQHLLDDTGARLAKVDRNTLGTDSATTYDQANNFLQAGRRAATENDYVAASGFAEKAAVLAAKLAPASP
ncbi:MAG: hypothetical protein ACREPW_07280 [Candidatus Binataceae bacterium]